MSDSKVLKNIVNPRGGISKFIYMIEWNNLLSTVLLSKLIVLTVIQFDVANRGQYL